MITLSGYGPLRIGLISPEVLEASNSEQTVALFRGDKIMKQIKENTAAVFEAMEVENLDEVACRQGSNAALFLVDGNEHIGNCITLKTFKPLAR